MKIHRRTPGSRSDLHRSGPSLFRKLNSGIVWCSLLVPAGILLCSSCIREERSGCPAWLTLEVPAGIPESDTLYLFVRQGDRLVRLDTLAAGPEPSVFEVPVPRGDISLSVFAGIRWMEYRDGFRIPEGEQADPLYTAFEDLRVDTDLLHREIPLHKNYSGLTLEVRGLPASGPDPAAFRQTAPSSWMFVLAGSTAGIGLDGEPVEGTFRFKALPSGSASPDDAPDRSCYVCRIPRQKHCDLTLYVSAAAPDSPLDPEPSLILPLAGFFEEAGIDFRETDLPDLYLVLDYARAELTVTVADWEHPPHWEIEC